MQGSLHVGFRPTVGLRLRSVVEVVVVLQIRNKWRSRANDRGFSVIEMVTTLLLASILTGIAVLNLRAFDDPLKNATAQFVSLLKQARAAAISSTSSYTVSAQNSTTIISERGITCTAATQTQDPRLALNLPTGSFLFDTTWSICFNSRGMPDGNIEIELRDEAGHNQVVEVLLGGSVRIQ